MGLPDNTPDGDGRRRQFAPTQWSLIIRAGGRMPDSREALESLCQAYWYPVYAHVRRRGFDADCAQDMTQGFFAQLLARDDLAKLDRGRGRFRSWILASLNHFLSNERDRARAQKRGGALHARSLSAEFAEERYRLEPQHELTPEKAYERRWAMTLLGQVIAQLAAEAAAAGRLRLFEVLKLSLMGEAEAGVFRRVAAELGMSESAVYVAAHRLRHRCRALLYDAVAQTVETPEDVEDEIRRLFAAVG